MVFFPLAWTIVHPIDKSSPLWELNQPECVAADVEVLVLLKGIDETFSQTVHTRSSYLGSEIEWAHKYVDIYLRDHDRIEGIDLSRLSETQPAGLPAS